VINEGPSSPPIPKIPTTIVSTVSARCWDLPSAATNADEAGVTITGATGTGFFIPTFRIQGTFNDNNPSIQEAVAMCVGLSSGLQLVSWKVVDASGNIIRGARVNLQIPTTQDP